MGVTIHFEGRLRGKYEFEACLGELKNFAEQHHWPLAEIPEATRTLLRVQNEEDWDYTGKTKGLVLQPHPNAEPFCFEVDEDLNL